MNTHLPEYLQNQPSYPIFLVTGPSGVGKDTILDEISKREDVERIITTSSRPIREFEEEGHPYYFVTKKEFEDRLKYKQFFEHDFHYGYWYGITHNELKEKLKTKKSIIWKVDLNGMKSISKILPYVITVGILPDSKDAPEKRFKNRGTDSETDLQKRLKEDKEWISYLQQHANHLVINKEGKIEEAIQDFHNIINEYT